MLDEDIIKQCIEGNRTAQEKLYNFYAPKMKGICVRYARSVVEAEDIFQDGFVKIFTNLKKYRNQGSFDGWVRRIIVNTAIDAYKANISMKNNVPYEELPETENTSIDIDDTLDEQELLNIVSKLPDGYRVVFNLYAIEGYSHKEIADMLNISEGTSKSQLSKARRTIQNTLYPYSHKSNDTGTI